VPSRLALAAFEQGLHRGGRALFQAYFDHRSHENAHHMAQKTVALDFEDEFAALSLPFGRIDRAEQIIGHGVLFAEGAEGMSAGEDEAGLSEVVKIQRTKASVCKIATYGVFTLVYTIAVAFALGAVTSVETVVDIFYGMYGNIGGQQGVEAAVHTLNGQGGMRVKMGDLAKGVGAGVGASRARRVRIVLGQYFYGTGEFGLHRSPFALDLPAYKVAAVVFY